MRSDEILSKIEDQVINLLKTTKLSHTKIGAMFGVSRGPIYKIQKLHNIKRSNIRKNDPASCKWCYGPIRFIKSKSRPNRFKYCNKECYRQWQQSEANKGPNNPHWIKDRSKLKDIFSSPEWEHWRLQVYTRDNYTCRNCNQRGGKLHPHHILYRRHFPQLTFIVGNGITLCNKCHNLVHNNKNDIQDIMKNKFLDILGLSEASLLHQ